jgi:uncharacterized Zn finger protein (UPF0148 family)
MQEKTCESCGMPMKISSDFGGAKTENLYCRYCTDETGKLKDFKTKYKETVNLVSSQIDVDEKVAEKIAKESMQKMPAWKSCF